MNDLRLVGAGFCLGMVITLIMLIAPLSIFWHADNIVEACELEIPRNQSCILTAIPKEKTKGE